MINIEDNFLSKHSFARLQDWVSANQFQIHTVGDKDFSVMPVPDHVLPLLEIEGHDMILTFLRNANKETNTDLRIHCDGIIENRKTSLARVLYLNDRFTCTENGTAFYEHHIHGIKAPDDISEEEFNRLLTEDSNNHIVWYETDFVSARPNRMLTYDSSYFHSKYPQVIEKGERVVLVAFYSETSN